MMCWDMGMGGQRKADNWTARPGYGVCLSTCSTDVAVYDYPYGQAVQHEQARCMITWLRVLPENDAACASLVPQVHTVKWK